MNDFLGSLTQGAGNAVGGSLVGTAISALTGGMKGRPQWRDIEFMDDVATRLTPNEASRQNQFLDLTHPEDTRRLTDRIKTLGKDLGMSAWELMGSQAGSPLPSPQLPTSSGQGTQGFMHGLVPLQIAKLNASTALQTTKMQTDTQKAVAGVTPQKGSMQEAQIAATKALQTLNELQGGLVINQTKAVSNETFLANLRILLDSLPSFSTSLPGVTMSGKSGTSPVLNALKEAVATGYTHDDDALKKAVSNMPTDRTAQLIKEIEALARAGGHAVKQGQDFLGQMLNFKK